MKTRRCAVCRRRRPLKALRLHPWPANMWCLNEDSCEAETQRSDKRVERRYNGCFAARVAWRDP